MSAAKARVLCVDDEPRVLDGLRLTLGRRCELTTAGSGAEALALLKKADQPYAVIVSDMRMPGMSGAELLARAREVSADSVRLLLTGHADIDSAVAAVNEGQIFRFLTKPCPSPQLAAAVEAAVEQHRLLTAERVLLEQTLKGAVHMLTDVLAMVSPMAFGRAVRVRELAAKLGARLEVRERWAVEIAAVMSQVGMISLPPGTVEKIYQGAVLSPDEERMLARLPQLTDDLLKNIPRMELVREMLGLLTRRYDQQSGEAPTSAVVGARVLKVVLDFDSLESSGLSVGLALEGLGERRGLYDPQVLEAFSALSGGAAEHARVLELGVSRLREGMVLAEAVTTRAGKLLCARGSVLNATVLERLENFSKTLGVREPIRVIVDSALEARHAG